MDQPTENETLMNRLIGPIYPILKIRFKGNDVAFVPMFQLDMVRKFLRKSVDERKWFDFTGNSVPAAPQERLSFSQELL